MMYTVMLYAALLWALSVLVDVLWDSTHTPGGYFTGHAKIDFLPPTRKRKWWEWLWLPCRAGGFLMTDLKFTEPDGTEWISYRDAFVDGLSSPWFTWLLAPPFSARGIRAFAMHDPACESKKRPSWQVHRMFYYAARCDGSPLIRAWAGWAMCRMFGPRF